jgi:23S rRNA pseudoU1915 N3-methylase RlmH
MPIYCNQSFHQVLNFWVTQHQWHIKVEGMFKQSHQHILTATGNNHTAITLSVQGQDQHSHRLSNKVPAIGMYNVFTAFKGPQHAQHKLIVSGRATDRNSGPLGIAVAGP